MQTSLYGLPSYLNAAPFTFDKIYSSRTEMETEKDNDNIYHGRYVLINYGDKYGNTPVNITTSLDATTNLSLASLSALNLNDPWIYNYNLDLTNYHNVYDGTVWRKEFTSNGPQYQLIASLNAKAPSLTIDTNYYSFELATPEEGNEGQVYWIKNGNNITSATKVATYPIPQWHDTYINDLTYHLDMPMPLRVSVTQEPDIFKAGLDPSTHSPNSDPNQLNPDNNYVRWEHTLTPGTDNQVQGAEFNFHVPAIGQAISDIYDALYGLPASGTNTRRTNPANFSAALNQVNNVGIIGVLKNLGLYESDPSATAYHLNCDWTITNGNLGYVKNKPKKITGITPDTSTGCWTMAITDNI